MAQYDRQWIDDLRRRVDIVQVVERYLPLQKQGRHWVGLCPFHNDTKPSMNVNPEMGIYKCFACGAGGDVFRFVMERDHTDFPEAVRIVAEIAGVPLPNLRSLSPEESALQKKQARLREIHNWAAEFFQQELKRENEPQEYLKRRKVTGQTAKEFSLGWAPDGWNGLTSYLKTKGVKEREMLESGLASQSSKSENCYDRFRKRVIFPIFSSTGQIIAFGGRALDPAEPAKYLNSPESPIYHKSEVLYGFSHAKEEIRRLGVALVVEGYLDILQLWQNKIRYAVAVSGTALTQQHALLLKRYAKKVYLVFDGDQAGRKAALRSVPLLLPQGIEVKVLLLPEGEDPDSLVRDHGPEIFLERIEREATDFVDFLASQHGFSPESSPEELADLVKEINALIALIPDPLILEGYRKKAAQLLQIQSRHLHRPPRQKDQGAPRFIPPPDGEVMLIASLINSAQLREIAARTLEITLFQDDRMREIADLLLLAHQSEEGFDLRNMMEKLSAEGRDCLERLLFNPATDPEVMKEEAALLIYLQTTLRLEQEALTPKLDKLRSTDSSEALKLWCEGVALLRQLEELHQKSALPDPDNASHLQRYLSQLFPLLRNFLKE